MEGEYMLFVLKIRHSLYRNYAIIISDLRIENKEGDKQGNNRKETRSEGHYRVPKGPITSLLIFRLKFYRIYFRNSLFFRTFARLKITIELWKKIIT